MQEMELCMFYNVNGTTGKKSHLEQPHNKNIQIQVNILILFRYAFGRKSSILRTCLARQIFSKNILF